MSKQKSPFCNFHSMQNDCLLTLFRDEPLRLFVSPPRRLCVVSKLPHIISNSQSHRYAVCASTKGTMLLSRSRTTQELYEPWIMENMIILKIKMYMIFPEVYLTFLASYERTVFQSCRAIYGFLARPNISFETLNRPTFQHSTNTRGYHNFFFLFIFVV